MSRIKLLRAATMEELEREMNQFMHGKQVLSISVKSAGLSAGEVWFASIMYADRISKFSAYGSYNDSR